MLSVSHGTRFTCALWYPGIIFIAEFGPPRLPFKTDNDDNTELSLLLSEVCTSSIILTTVQERCLKSSCSAVFSWSRSCLDLKKKKKKCDSHIACSDKSCACVLGRLILFCFICMNRIVFLFYFFPGTLSCISLYNEMQRVEFFF